MTEIDLYLKGLGIEKPDNLIDEDLSVYDCKVCKDTGYYSSLGENGVDKYMHECSCLAEIKTREYLRLSGLDEFLTKTVNNFEIEYKHQADMKQMAIDYVLENSREWFVMLGASGSGKTHLCAAVTKTLIEKGLQAIYIVWTDFVNELNALMFEDDDRRALDKYKRIPVLYIDDFFKGRITDYNLLIAFDLINYRVNNNLTTIISSEMLLDDLDKVDSALAGRISMAADKGNYIIEINKGENRNYRQAKNTTRKAGN